MTDRQWIDREKERLAMIERDAAGQRRFAEHQLPYPEHREKTLKYAARLEEHAKDIRRRIETLENWPN